MKNYWYGGVADELDPNPQVEVDGMASLGAQGSGSHPCGRAHLDGSVPHRNISRYPDGADVLHCRARDGCFLVMGKLDVCHAGDHSRLLLLAVGISFDVPSRPADGPLDLDYRGRHGDSARSDSDDHHSGPFRAVHADAVAGAGGPF